MKKISLNKNSKTSRDQVRKKANNPKPTSTSTSKPKITRQTKNSQQENKIKNLTTEKQKKKFRFNVKHAIYIFLTLTLILASAYGVFRIRTLDGNIINNGDGTVSQACRDIFNPECWTQAFRPQLNQTDNKTNALLVGIDTRSSGSGAGLANTDTIILATYYHDTGKVRLISFPRDLYAPYNYSEGGPTYYTKINAIYNSGERYAPDNDGMRVLGDTIKTITGETDIHYNALIRLEGVVESIDALGGITVDVPEKIVDVYPYVELSPERQQECVRWSLNRAYCLFTYEQGITEMDGESALIYSRMRQLSNDFERGRRQQIVINGIKNTIAGDELSTAEKAQNLFKIYNSVNKYIDIELDLETILAAVDLIDQIDTDPLSIVLDPTFGGGGYIVNGEGSNYNFAGNNYAGIQNELRIIEENADVFSEKPKIYAVNYTGLSWVNEDPPLVYKTGDFWYLETITNTLASPLPDRQGVVVVDYTGENPNTIEKIKSDYSALGTSVKELSIDEASELGINKSTEYEEEVGIYIFSKGDLLSEQTE